MSVILPPVILDKVTGVVDDVSGAHFVGPYVIGMAQYVILISESEPSPPFHHFLTVFKSVDNGVTWVSMDSLHRPNTGQNFDPILNGTVFTICYSSNTINNPLKFITFDTSTDTFGAPSVDGPFTGGNVRIAQFASGDICVWYGAFGGLQSVLIFSGGAFGAATAVPNTKNDAVVILIGPDNVANLIYFDLVAIGPTFFNNLFFRTFTNGGVLGAEQQIFHVPATVLRSSDPIGRSVIWNNGGTNQFIIPAFGGTNGTQAGVWIGTPYNAPVWSFTLVDPVVQPPNAGDFAPFSLIDNSNNLIVFYTTLNIDVLVNMSFATNSGTGFGPPQQFYNQLLNPPLDPPISPGPSIDVLIASIARYANGKFGSFVSFCGCPTAQCIGVGYLLDTGAGGSSVGNVRLQIYDDGAGEYLFNAPFNSLLVSGSENPATGLSGSAIGPFILPSPLMVTKPGFLTIAITNVNPPLNAGFATPNTVIPFVALVFAIPKKCRGQVPSIFKQQGRRGILS